MSRKILPLILILLLAALVLTGCGGDDEDPTVTPEPTDAPTEAPEASGTIVLGDISDDPAKKIARFQPVADYLAANLGDFGIGVGEVVIAPDMETMAELLENGEVDFMFDSLYPALTISDLTGAQPVLRRWKDGVEQYNSIFFVRADSGLTSVEDLLGQVVAFDEPNSTSGFMLPMAHLIESDLSAVEVDSTDASVADDEVGYFFSGDDENTLQWVISGRVIAGVVDNETFAEIPEESQEEITILAETEFLARQVMMVRPGFDEDLLAEVITLLVELDEQPEGPEILETFKTSQLDEFPDGADAAMARMREIVELVQGE